MSKLTSSILLAAALSVIFAYTGCGNSESEFGSLTRAEFIKQADAICTRTDAKQEAAFAAYLQKHPDARSSKAKEEELVLKASLPPLAMEAEELGALPAPKDGEEEVAAIVSGLSEAIKEAEANPGEMLLASYGPFTEVVKLVEKFGFKACNDPL